MRLQDEKNKEGEVEESTRRTEYPPSSVMRYLNRLSDYLFVAARYSARREGKEEVTYKKEK